MRSSNPILRRRKRLYSKFHCFSSLPIELRIRIWQYAVHADPPKIVKIQKCCKLHRCRSINGVEVETEALRWDHMHGDRPAKSSALLSATQESRYEAQRAGKLVSHLTPRSYLPTGLYGHGHAMTGDISVTYFRFEVDTLTLSIDRLLRVNQSTMSGFERVQRLIVTGPAYTDTGRNYREPRYVHELVSALRNFTALRHLHLAEGEFLPRPTDTKLAIVPSRAWRLLSAKFWRVRGSHVGSNKISMIGESDDIKNQISFLRGARGERELDVEPVFLARYGPGQGVDTELLRNVPWWAQERSIGLARRKRSDAVLHFTPDWLQVTPERTAAKWLLKVVR